MKQTGHIEIKDNKVVFVYYELKKPDLDDYTKDSTWGYAEYNEDLDKYQASKREVEISNVTKHADPYEKVSFFFRSPEIIALKNNQPCEAEVTDNKATIIELL